METYFAKKEGTAAADADAGADRAAVPADDPVIRRSPRRPRAGAQRTQRPVTPMFERRLFFHVDWLLLGADPADRRDRRRR